jgi:glutaredoxin
MSLWVECTVAANENSHPGRDAMLLVKLFLLSAVSLATSDLRVLFFTMDSCPPCRQTEPGIDQLRREGVAVSKIDVRQHQDYARQCQVFQTPTIMVVNGNRVLARHTGALGYGDLRRMLAEGQSAAPGDVMAESASTDSMQIEQRQAVSVRSPHSGPARMSAQQRAMQATVRFRVEDSEGVSYATGTIIHRQGDEALVLTCGHVFRESGGSGKINADLGFSGGAPQTVVGKLLFYNSDEHDIALVTIPCPLPIEPVAVAPEALSVQTGDRIFSIGCDRGAAPSIRQSVLKAITTYSGVAKYDIVGRPVDGRSGGGLFSAGGQLIGVCNAAAVEVDEGIYTGLQSVYWQFAKTNLTHLFNTNKKNSTGPESGTSTERLAATLPPASSRSSRSTGGPQSETPGQLAHPSTRPLAASASQSMAIPASHNVSPAVYQGGPSPPVNRALHRGNQIPTQLAQQQTAQPSQPDMEMIVIVRSRSNPAATQTITIDNPDSGTLAWLHDRGQGPASDNPAAPWPGDDRRMVDQTARLPNLPKPRNRSGQEQFRAQSPR